MTAPFLLLEKRERGIIKKTVNTGKRGGKMKKFFYKRKKLCILIGMYLLFLLFVSQDAWLYDTTIAKITKVQTEKTGEKETWVDNVDFYQSSSGSRIRNHSALLDPGGICA